MTIITIKDLLDGRWAVIRNGLVHSVYHSQEDAIKIHNRLVLAAVTYDRSFQDNALKRVILQ